MTKDEMPEPLTAPLRSDILEIGDDQWRLKAYYESLEAAEAALGLLRTGRNYEITTAPAPPSVAAHPEDYCHRCGRPNIVWFGPNEIWNKAVRAINEKEILCPVCFVELAEQAGFKGTWQVWIPSEPSAAAIAAAREIYTAHASQPGDGSSIQRAVVDSIAAIITRYLPPAPSVPSAACAECHHQIAVIQGEPYCVAIVPCDCACGGSVPWATVESTCKFCGGKVQHVCTAFHERDSVPSGEVEEQE